MAIIAILAAILLPALAAAKWRADLAVCKGNLHQIGLGVIMYANDTGFYPGLVHNTTGRDLDASVGDLRPHLNYDRLAGTDFRLSEPSAASEVQS
ncbi:MAG: hypothetical protein ACYDH9_24525 [Limisphaerales bacterium]